LLAYQALFGSLTQQKLMITAKSTNCKPYPTLGTFAPEELYTVAAEFSLRRKFCCNREEENFFLRENFAASLNNLEMSLLHNKYKCSLTAGKNNPDIYSFNLIINDEN
jgi:hypothetical protein